VGEIALENENVAEIDINPLILCGAKPVAVDALIVLMS
jgi:acetyl-CoA synthetase (ADP-forming)